MWQDNDNISLYGAKATVSSHKFGKKMAQLLPLQITITDNSYHCPFSNVTTIENEQLSNNSVIAL